MSLIGYELAKIQTSIGSKARLKALYENMLEYRHLLSKRIVAEECWRLTSFYPLLSYRYALKVYGFSCPSCGYESRHLVGTPDMDQILTD
ncbi:MAG: hypothetical protein ACREBU_19665, partial [Nitrososphaera sp.]